MPDHSMIPVPAAVESERAATEHLARLLAEFDEVLALELRDHLIARADQWSERPQASRAARARRYRLLAEQLRTLLGPGR